jgi:uncharacterized cupredoxin-like copper-binding protein
LRIPHRLLIVAAGVALFATACSPSTGSGGSGGGGGTAVNVTATEFKFEAAPATFPAGQPIRITVKNSGTVEHEWDLMPVGEMDHSKSLAMIPSTELKAGATVSRTFTVPNKGNYEFACHLPGHYEAGMKLPVTVS